MVCVLCTCVCPSALVSCLCMVCSLLHCGCVRSVCGVWVYKCVLGHMGMLMRNGAHWRVMLMVAECDYPTERFWVSFSS